MKQENFLAQSHKVQYLSYLGVAFRKYYDNIETL